jgi:hypothetical protein
VTIGAGLIRLGSDLQQQAAAVQQLRQSQIVGNVVLVRATRDLKAAVSVWGPRQNPALLDAVKRAMDPRNTLGAGRGPV